jgi:hypothetical protein
MARFLPFGTLLVRKISMPDMASAKCSALAARFVANAKGRAMAGNTPHVGWGQSRPGSPGFQHLYASLPEAACSTKANSPRHIAR